MANFRRMAWCAAAALAVTGAPVLAQQQGGTNTGTGGNTGNTGSTQQLNTANNPGTISGGALGIPGASTSITGGIEQPQNQFELAAVKQPPSRTTTNNTAIATSNIFRNSFGSVYYQGSDPLQVPNRNPGSFGTAIFQATGTAGGRGGQGAAGAAGGRGGALTDPGGQIVQLPRQIAYTSQIQFKMPAGNPVPQLQSDLRTSIDRVPTNMLTNPAGVQVAVDGRNVTLKGSVRDEEESRLVEGMVRLTPGVFGIKNELTFAK